MAKFVEIVGWIVIGISIVILIALLYTVPLYYLWNWLMPKIFGLTRITLLQALGISLLSGILFRSSNSKSKD